MLLSKLTSGVAKPLTRHEEVLPTGPRSATDGGSPCLNLVCTLSTLQAKLRCPLNGLDPWVPPSLSAVGHCASVWSYYLVRASGDAN
jgi:hypothetical protein